MDGYSSIYVRSTYETCFALNTSFAVSTATNEWYFTVWMVFMERGFTSRGQVSGSVFSAAVCKIQASKRYIKSLPLVPKEKKSCFSQGERSTVQLPLDRAFAHLPSRSRTLNWHLKTIFTLTQRTNYRAKADFICGKELYVTGGNHISNKFVIPVRKKYDEQKFQ